MKIIALLFAALGLCFGQVHPLSAQPPRPTRVVFDRAHGELPPPGQLAAVAKKLGLDIVTSDAPISAAVLENARMLYLRAP